MIIITKFSKPCLLPIGVPQGTILGPLLFILYANDLFHNISTGTCVMYADDITLYCSAKSINEVQYNLQTCVDDTIKWLQTNKLVVNPLKCNSMLVGSRQKVNNLTLKIMINNIPVTYTRSFKLLGVTVDSNLTWGNHIMNNELYPPLFQSNLDYCLTVWGHSADKHIVKLQKLQNRVARIITKNFNRNIPGLEIVKNLGWMSVKERFDYLTACLMYKCLCFNTSNMDYLVSVFDRVQDTHCHDTRLGAANGLNKPLPRTEYYKCSLSVFGANLWNKLPINVKNTVNIHGFEKSYKSHFF